MCSLMSRSPPSSLENSISLYEVVIARSLGFYCYLLSTQKQRRYNTLFFPYNVQFIKGGGVFLKVKVDHFI